MFLSRCYVFLHDFYVSCFIIYFVILVFLQDIPIGSTCIWRYIKQQEPEYWIILLMISGTFAGRYRTQYTLHISYHIHTHAYTYVNIYIIYMYVMIESIFLPWLKVSFISTLPILLCWCFSLVLLLSISFLRVLYKK